MYGAELPSTSFGPLAKSDHAQTAFQVVYMGKDKYENEELLKYGFPEATDRRHWESR